MPKPRTKPVHGTISCYNNWGCRCPLCKAAMADYRREYRRTLRELLSQMEQEAEAQNAESREHASE